MKWPKRILILVTSLLAITVALPFFVSLDDYIPRIEKEMSARLNEPVSVKDISFAALPLPHVTLDGITIGTADDISLGKVRVTPDLFSLLNPTKVIKSIEIDSITLTQEAIAKIPLWSRPEAAKSRQPPRVRVELIRLSEVLVKFGKMNVAPFDARISLDSEGEPKDVSIASRDGKLKVFIKPEHSSYLIDASAKAWQLPVGPPIVFDELTIKGVATLHDADLSQVNAKLYGGVANGKATIGWRKGLQFKCNLDIDRVETREIAAMLSSKTRVSGKLRASPVVSASAPSADRLMNALRLETPFSVHDGVIHGVDIQKAATGLAGQGSSGGETRFNHLSGYLVMARGGYRFTQLQISSGVLAGEGSVNISARKELSGRIDARVKAMGTSAGVPLNVAGTLDAPLLYPTAGTLAGAAVGTAILGPGFGTSVGAKAGNWAEGWFDGKKENSAKK